MKRLIPQWLAGLVCGSFGHPLRTFVAQRVGLHLIVRTCRCGKRQTAKLYTGQFPLRR